VDVFFRVGDRDLFLFRVVLEVVMIASGSRKVPTVLLQHLDDLPAAPTLGRTTTKSIPESMSAAPRRTIISRVSPFSIIPDGCGENSSSFFRWSSGRKCTERFAERRIMRVTTDVAEMDAKHGMLYAIYARTQGGFATGFPARHFNGNT
jgi:hypothetical protein